MNNETEQRMIGEFKDGWMDDVLMYALQEPGTFHRVRSDPTIGACPLLAELPRSHPAWFRFRVRGWEGGKVPRACRKEEGGERAGRAMIRSWIPSYAIQASHRALQR